LPPKNSGAAGNLISAWREYFDPGDVARQLHMSADAMGELLQG
jgi:hypothetical protein